MTFWHITAKDLYLLVRDRRTATNLLLLPLAFITIIGLTTGQLLGWQRANEKIKIAAIDRTDYDAIGSREFLVPPNGTEDDAEAPPAGDLPAEDRDRERNVAAHLAYDILNRLQGTPGVEVRTVEDWWAQSDLGNRPEDLEQAARRLIAANDVNAAVVFRPDFYRSFYHLGGVDLIADDGDAASAAHQLGRIRTPAPRQRSRRSSAITLSECCSRCSRTAAAAGPSNSGPPRRSVARSIPSGGWRRTRPRSCSRRNATQAPRWGAGPTTGSCRPTR
jgi:hypothetical protein